MLLSLIFTYMYEQLTVHGKSSEGREHASEHLPPHMLKMPKAGRELWSWKNPVSTQYNDNDCLHLEVLSPGLSQHFQCFHNLT